MITKYRCVLSIENDEPILIGIDDNQDGKAYIDNDNNIIGYWSDFVFVNIPDIPEDILKISKLKKMSPYKIINSSLCSKVTNDFF